MPIICVQLAGSTTDSLKQAGKCILDSCTTAGQFHGELEVVESGDVYPWRLSTAWPAGLSKKSRHC